MRSKRQRASEGRFIQGWHNRKGDEGERDEGESTLVASKSIGDQYWGARLVPLLIAISCYS
jgi:hypothetical protein